jgi:hypothetical protein
MPVLSRRAFLATALLPAAFPIGRAAAQGPAAPLTFSSVAVDVTHLREIGLGPIADIIQAAMTDELRALFADRMNRNGPRLVVAVTGVFFASLPDAGGGDYRDEGSFRTPDSLDGEAFVLGRRGEILARFPQHNNLIATGVTWQDPFNEQKRAAAVARNYAQWLRRYTIP